MLAVEVTELDDTEGFGEENETEMKDGADQVKATGPLKAPVPVRVRVVAPMLPGARGTDAGLAVILKSGWVGFTSHTCNIGPKTKPVPGLAQLPPAGYIRKFTVWESVEPKVTVVDADVLLVLVAV